MRIADLTCPTCNASYEMAEAVTIESPADHENCAVCGETLARWSDYRLKAFRLVIPVERKYASVAVPPSPSVSSLRESPLKKKAFAD
jgi:tRNA U54 and U55 pseudouridine synthase Pus10